jgi:Tellurite resistance protein TehB
MENNRRGNKQMQSVMHELSHGDNASKKRLKLDIALFAILVPLGLILPHNAIQVLGAVTMIIFLIRNWSINKQEQKEYMAQKMSEPKNENKNIYLMSGFWENLENREEALDAILTGYEGDAINMPVYGEVIKHLNHAGSILDFGCGAGRNLKYLIDQYEMVYGYDYVNMLKFIPEEIMAAKNLILTSMYDYVLLRNYDEVLFSLVLQHIHVDELHEILKGLSLHSRRFIIHSRTWLDFTFEPIMPILEQYFKVDTIEYQKDPNSSEDDHFIGIFLPRS